MLHKDPLTNLDDIPRVCLLEDLARIFRVPVARLKAQYKCDDLTFTALPTLDRLPRFSGEYVKWFLGQDSFSFRLVGETRRRKQPVKKTSTRANALTRPCATSPTAPSGGDDRLVDLEATAAILRMKASGLQRAARQPGFPLPPAKRRPLMWSESEISTFLSWSNAR